MQNQKVQIKAKELIPQYGCVTAYGELANSNNGAHQSHIIGVTAGEIQNTEYGDATVQGVLFDKDWAWTAGAPIYLNGTILSHTPPAVGFTQQVGWAISPQHVLVNLI